MEHAIGLIVMAVVLFASTNVDDVFISSASSPTLSAIHRFSHHCLVAVFARCCDRGQHLEYLRHRRRGGHEQEEIAIVLALLNFLTLLCLTPLAERFHRTDQNIE
jgi:hypothetical protein